MHGTQFAIVVHYIRISSVYPHIDSILWHTRCSDRRWHSSNIDQVHRPIFMTFEWCARALTTCPYTHAQDIQIEKDTSNQQYYLQSHSLGGIYVYLPCACAVHRPIRGSRRERHNIGRAHRPYYTITHNIYHEPQWVSFTISIPHTLRRKWKCFAFGIDGNINNNNDNAEKKNRVEGKLCMYVCCHRASVGFYNSLFL